MKTTEATDAATIIQTRHRIPEAPLKAGQIVVYQVPQPEPLRKLEPREAETRKMHAWAEYGLMQVKLYENIARFGEVTTTYDYPVMVNGRYIMAPSPIPKFDNPKMHMSPALQLFGAGREKRIYALPPHTSVRSLDFEDHPFRIQSWNEPCGLCGASDSYLDEVVTDDRGGRMFVCSDSHHCETRRAEGHRGAMLGERRRALQLVRPVTRSGQDPGRHDPVRLLARSRRTLHQPSARSRTAALGRRRQPLLWRAHRLRRCLLRALAGRGARHRRRVRLGQVDAAALPRRHRPAGCGRGAVPRLGRSRSTSIRCRSRSAAA